MNKPYYENSQYRTAIKKSQINEEAMRLVNQHYRYLYSKLVLTENDRDLFNDTVLSISYKYDPTKDFVNQFIFHFKSNQVGLVQENKIRNYLVAEMPDNYDTIDEDEPESEAEKITMNELITSIKDARIEEIAKKRKAA